MRMKDEAIFYVTVTYWSFPSWSNSNAKPSIKKKLVDYAMQFGCVLINIRAYICIARFNRLVVKFRILNIYFEFANLISSTSETHPCQQCCVWRVYFSNICHPFSFCLCFIFCLFPCHLMWGRVCVCVCVCVCAFVSYRVKMLRDNTIRFIPQGTHPDQ